MRYCILKKGIAQIPTSQQGPIEIGGSFYLRLGERRRQSWNHFRGRTSAWEFIIPTRRMQGNPLACVHTLQIVPFSSTQSTAIWICEGCKESRIAGPARRVPAGQTRNFSFCGDKQGKTLDLVDEIMVPVTNVSLRRESASGSGLP